MTSWFATSSRVLMTTMLFVCLLVVAFLPTTVVGECSCELSNDGDKKSETLKYKLAAFFTTLVASAIGFYLPTLAKKVPALSPEKNAFFMVKIFASGVILATGCVHILPEAFDKLTSPCLKGEVWVFPWAGFVVMVVSVLTLMLDNLATTFYTRSEQAKSIARTAVDEENHDEENHVPIPVHTQASHGHSHGSSIIPSTYDGPISKELIRFRVVSQVLEFGIVVHSVIIGLALGASESTSYIKPLVPALAFHQFFEGMGLGGCITQAELKTRGVTIMALFFSLTTPLGIAIGIGITNVYHENSPTALIVEGILNSAASGLLIYMALVDLLAADFATPRLQANIRLQMIAYASLLVGAGIMSLMAKWA